nr:MAG TPA: hypothetical protein [Caudoviricetes sp.]
MSPLLDHAARGLLLCEASKLIRWRTCTVQVRGLTPTCRRPRRRSTPGAWADISHLWLACRVAAPP